MGVGVTVIVGAGAALDFEHMGVFPSVKTITEEVLKISTRKVDGTERLLIKNLYDGVIERLKNVGNPEVRKFIHPEVSFEDLLHVLEMCLSYSSCWHDEYLHWKVFPLYGALMEPDQILKDINTVEYERAAYALEERVMKIVNQYDSAFKKDKSREQWYRDFWHSMKGANVFSLNYDSTIEESVESYEDGFDIVLGGEEYSRFSAKRYYENRENKTTIAHLHGSILYSEPKSFPFKYSIRDLVKNKDYESALKNRIMSQSAPRTQAKEVYVQPYIISGARKTEKMVVAPYDVYLSDLTRKVLENKRLMLIGYSFGDLYLNEILGLGIAAHGDEFRALIIDKFPAYIHDYLSLYQELKGLGMNSFVSRVSRDELSIKPGQKEFPLDVKDYDTPVVSKNGNLMICLAGFKDAVTKHREEIKDFLYS